MILLILAGDADWVEVHTAAPHMALSQVDVPKLYVIAFLLSALKPVTFLSQPIGIMFSTAWDWGTFSRGGIGSDESRRSLHEGLDR